MMSDYKTWKTEELIDELYKMGCRMQHVYSHELDKYLETVESIKAELMMRIK